MTTNWAGNHTYRAARIHRPSTLDELRGIVAAAPRIRAWGTRHTFTAIGDSDELVSLAGLPADVVFDGDTVRCGGGMTYGELARAIEGSALHNLASLPHISVAGAIATATHGSGDRNGNLATAVAALELVTSSGDVLRTKRGDADFDGIVVGLGALGVVTRVTLDVGPAYQVRQRVFEHLSWDALFAHFEAVMDASYSVSVFTRWGEDVDMVWLKSRYDEAPDVLFDARPATVDRHPIMELDPVNCTAQLGIPGPWWDRLPHFRMGFTPSAGDEVQSEYHVPREHAVAALKALREIAHVIRPHLQVSELRTVAADRLWLSPQYERDTLGIHFTWKPDQLDAVIDAVEATLAPFAPRAHWGKRFATAGDYPRRGDFARLADRLDPRGAFRNEWLTTHLGLG